MSHIFIHRTLAHLDLPQSVLNLIKALYDENACTISFAGKQYPGFPMTSGIRQGCPLSPLLVVVVVDSLLRTLARRIPGCLIRAYADDTAMVVNDLTGQLDHVAEIFTEFAHISGLCLNLPQNSGDPIGGPPASYRPEGLC